jgi:peptide/nickel transport system substrate-binding protein
VQDYSKKEESFASRNTNGTGAFILKSWEPDKRVVFEANKGWWDKPEGNVTEMVYTPIKSDATRVSALLSGDVDLVTDLPVQDVERLRKDPKLKVVDGTEARTVFLAMDQHNEELKYSNVKGRNPFKDLRVRKALNLAIDREAIKRVTMRNLAIPAGIMVPPGVQGWSKDIDVAEKVDLAAAKKLLAEAGYPNGFEFTLDCPNNRYVNDEKICQAVVGMWAKAGINARLNAMPFATYIPKLLNLDTSAYMLGWGVATLDANFTLQSLLRTKTTGADGSFNQGRVSDPKLDSIIDTLKFANEANGRSALLREGLVRTRDQYYYVPLHHQMRPWAMKKGVSPSYDLLDAHHARFTRVN